ncbi:MAG: adenylate kinase family protein [Candidatus Woesearchaeota archaeon]
MKCIIMGPQGSGKGTQAKLIAKEFGLDHISIGDILRKEVASGTDDGRLIENYMAQGKLIPLELNNKIVKDAISGRENIIFDGYPRNLDQANFLFDNFDIHLLIVLEISEAESIRRISKRVICSANNKNLIDGELFLKDIAECEARGGRIIRRDDDMPDAISRRLKIYHENTEPLIKLFEDRKVPVFRISGERGVDEIFSEIKKDIVHLFDKK